MLEVKLLFPQRFSGLGFGAEQINFNPRLTGAILRRKAGAFLQVRLCAFKCRFVRKLLCQSESERKHAEGVERF